MKIITKSLTALSIVISSASHSFGQDPAFSQFYSNPVYTNPAAAGATAGGRFVHSHRIQWPGLPGTFVTASESYDQYFNALRGGIALIATFDKSGGGLYSTNNVGLAYAFEQKITDKLALRAGFQAAFVQKSIDFSQITFGDMIEPRSGFKFPTNEPITSDVKNFANFATGIMLCSERFYAGIAVHNFTQPNQSFYNSPSHRNNLPARFTFHGGISIPLGGKSDLPLNEQFTLNPYIMVLKQQVFGQANLGCYLNTRYITTGLGIRLTPTNPDAVIGMLGFRIKRKVTLAYSYDRTISDARTAATGSHELSLSVKWRSVKSQGDGNRIICPSF